MSDSIESFEPEGVSPVVWNPEALVLDAELQGEVIKKE